MKIWEVCPDANRYLCVQQLDLRFFNDRFDGQLLGEKWSSPDYDILNRSKNVADFTSWQIGSRSFLISSRAVGLLRPLVSNKVEFLPFATIKGTELFAVNVCDTVPVIDWRRSICNAHTIDRIALLPTPVQLPLLFKDPDLPSYTFASDALGELAIENRLTGLQLADPEKNRLRQIVRGEQINEFPGLSS